MLHDGEGGEARGLGAEHEATQRDRREPPSGPMTIRSREAPRAACESRTARSPGSRSRPRRSGSARSRPARSASVWGASTAGTSLRPHWRAASWAMRRSRTVRRSARSSSRRTADLSAASGRMRVAPSSVAFCTTRSSFSPLASACASQTSAAPRSGSTRGPSRSTPGESMRAGQRAPRPSNTSSCAPGPSRSTTSRWRDWAGSSRTNSAICSGGTNKRCKLPPRELDAYPAVAPGPTGG